jgi:HAD superfamily hydrolase (TIGR01509 family)
MPTDQTSTLRAILWDMDGTLIDSEPLWVESERELMSRFGYSWSEADALHCLGGPMPRVSAYMYEKSGRFHDPEWFSRELISLMLKRVAGDVPFMPGAQELLLQAGKSGKKQALVSASERPIVDVFFSRLINHFQMAIAAGDVEKTKPDPLPYLNAAERLSLKIEECLIIEDSLVGVTSGLDSGALVLALHQHQEVSDHPNLIVRESLTGITVEELEREHLLWSSINVGR